MRATKFRARDRELGNREYFVFDQVGQHPQDELERTVGIGSPIWLQAVKDKRIDFSTWGQFTGLHDKKGKEIYDGDIVRFLYNSTPQEERIGVVEFNTDGMGYTFDGLYIEPTPRKTIEVISSIYENPELLTR